MEFFQVLGEIALVLLMLSIISFQFAWARRIYVFAVGGSACALVISIIAIVALTKPSTDRPVTVASSPAVPTSPQTSDKDETAAPSKVAGEMVIQGDAKFGCVDRERFEKLGRLISEGDHSAFKSEMLKALLEDQCVPFKDGETVYLEDTALLSGLIKVRRKSEGTEYWTVMEAAK